MAKLPKKPKSPKRSAGLSSWENYDARVRAWHSRINQIKSDIKKKEALIRKYRG